MFNNWADNMLKEIFLNCEKIRVAFDQTIFKEGDKPNSIYIIKTGLFQVNISRMFYHIIRHFADDKAGVNKDNR